MGMGEGSCTVGVHLFNYLVYTSAHLGGLYIELELYIIHHDHLLFICCFDYFQAFFSGKLKISGNTALAMKLQNVIPRPPKAKL